MDLRIPYTFYPLVLPPWVAWALFLAAIVGGLAVGVRRGRARGWTVDLVAALVSGAGFLLVTMLVSMVIAFFVHDF